MSGKEWKEALEREKEKRRRTDKKVEKLKKELEEACKLWKEKEKIANNMREELEELKLRIADIEIECETWRNDIFERRGGQYDNNNNEESEKESQAKSRYVEEEGSAEEAWGFGNKYEEIKQSINDYENASQERRSEDEWENGKDEAWGYASYVKEKERIREREVDESFERERLSERNDREGSYERENLNERNVGDGGRYREEHRMQIERQDLYRRREKNWIKEQNLGFFMRKERNWPEGEHIEEWLSKWIGYENFQWEECVTDNQAYRVYIKEGFLWDRIWKERKELLAEGIVKIELIIPLKERIIKKKILRKIIQMRERVKPRSIRVQLEGCRASIDGRWHFWNEETNDLEMEERERKKRESVSDEDWE